MVTSENLAKNYILKSAWKSKYTKRNGYHYHYCKTDIEALYTCLAQATVHSWFIMFQTDDQMILVKFHRVYKTLNPHSRYEQWSWSDR